MNSHQVHVPHAHQATLVPNDSWDQNALERIDALQAALTSLRAKIVEAHEDGPLSDSDATFREISDGINVTSWAGYEGRGAFTAARMFRKTRFA